jgi:uncharacterized protein
MGTTADNVAKLRDAYTRWHETKGTSDQMWLDLLADNVRVLSLAAGRPGVEFTSEVRSKKDLERYFEGLRADWEMIHYTTSKFVADGDTVSALCRTGWRNRKTGKVMDTPKADFAVFKDGKIVEWYEFYDTAAFLAATQK